MLGCSSPSTCPARRSSPSGARSRRRASSDCGSRPTRASGARRPTPRSRRCTTPGFMTPEICYVHASSLNEQSYQKIAATGGTVVGRDGVGAERRAGVPVELGDPPVRHPRVDLDGHERVVERGLLLGDARDPQRRPLARPPRGARAQRDHRREPAARRGRGAHGDDGRGEVPRHGGPDRLDHARARRPTCCSSRTTSRPR